MRKMCALALGILCLTAFAPRAAEARGGNFRGPGGAIPPGLREPSDPSPPPPPPPLVRTPSGALPTTPTPMPTPPPVPARPPTRPAASVPAGVMTFADWRFWYLYNREVLEARVPERRRSAVASGLVPATILPALLWAADLKAGGDPHVQMAAYVALGRAISLPEHVDLLNRAAQKPSNPLIEQYVMLGLGLLRRSDPARRFEASSLDRVRTTLLAVVKDTKRHSRTRAFAATSLGLLADQPTRSPAVAKATTARLAALLQEQHRHPDVVISVLHALSLQPATTITEAQRDIVRGGLTQGVLGARHVHTFLRAHLALALGRMGTVKDVPLLREVATSRRSKSVNGKRSAVIALATLGARLEPDVRSTMLQDLTALLRAEVERKADPKKHPKLRPMDDTQRNLLLIALARIAAVDLSETDGLTNRIGGATDFLRRRLAQGTHDEVAYSALALAWLGRGMRASDNAERRAWLRVTNTLLRGRLGAKALAPSKRGAIAVALGLLGDPASRAPLRTLVADRRQDMSLRGAAARGLGMLAQDDPDRAALLAGFSERRSEMFTIDCAAGLGLAGADGAGPTLLASLRGVRSQFTQAAAVQALGDLGLGARAAVPGLIQIVKDKNEHAMTRSVAVAALGLIADQEPRAALAHVLGHMNWRASTDYLNALFGTL